MIKTIYECDACGMQTNDPYTIHMKEFDITILGCFESFGKQRKKIHLCPQCFRGLQAIAQDRHGENTSEETR